MNSAPGFDCGGASSGDLLETRLRASRRQHRAADRRLDELLAAIRRGDFLGSFRKAHALVARHYRAEEPLVREIAQRHAVLAAKIAAQHDEALEFAAAVEEAAARDLPGDALRLAKRFCAIAQHNIIEEERDVFPLVEEWARSARR